LWFSPHGNARGVFIVCDVALATAGFAIAVRPAILAQAVLRAHVRKTISGNIWQVNKADNAHEEADNHAHHAKRPQAAAVFW
jgi:hypothetical protein